VSEISGEALVGLGFKKHSDEVYDFRVGRERGEMKALPCRVVVQSRRDKHGWVIYNENGVCNEDGRPVRHEVFSTLEVVWFLIATALWRGGEEKLDEIKAVMGIFS